MPACAKLACRAYRFAIRNSQNSIFTIDVTPQRLMKILQQSKEKRKESSCIHTHHKYTQTHTSTYKHTMKSPLTQCTRWQRNVNFLLARMRPSFRAYPTPQATQRLVVQLTIKWGWDILTYRNIRYVYMCLCVYVWMCVRFSGCFCVLIHFISIAEGSSGVNIECHRHLFPSTFQSIYCCSCCGFLLLLLL